MADDRTIRVRLLAEIQNYQQGMKQAAATTAQFARENAAQIESVGRNMTRYLTIPLLATGGAAVKMAGDFETSFSSLVGLAGVPAGEVDALRQNVLDLAGETARAPQELADALYEAASAGLDANGAMAAVTVAARGAAAGLGDTQDIVGLVASAIASYGEANINAAEATDILTATIREGRADPAELAGTLGRVLPVASQLGVSFSEVGGAVAYLSNVFGDTNRTVTATQGLLIKLLSPTQQGRDTLDEMGTSVEDLHDAISDDGLLGALELLKEHGFDANQQALAKLFDDIEGRQAALALLADESGSLASMLDATATSAGALEEALGERMGTDAQKARQAIVDLQVSLIEIGTLLAPIASDVAAFASLMFKWFSSLPDPMQKAAIALGGFVAVAGPAILIGSKLHSAWVVVGPMLQKLGTQSATAATGVSALSSAALGLAAALPGIMAALNLQNNIDRQGNDALTEFMETLPDARTASEFASNIDAMIAKYETFLSRASGGDGIKGFLTEVNENLNPNLPNTIADAESATRAFEDAIASAIPALERWQAAEAEVMEATGMTSEEVNTLAANVGVDLSAAGERGEQAVQTLIDAFHGTGPAGKVAQTAIGEVAAEAVSLVDAFNATFDPFFQMQDALASLEAAHDDVASAQEAHADAVRNLARTQSDVAQDIADAQQAVVDSSAAVEEAQLGVAEAMGIVADRAAAARQGVADLASEQRAAIDPLFAMVEAVQRLEDLKNQAQSSVKGTKTGENSGKLEAQDGKEPTALELAQAAAGVQSAATNLAGAIALGDVSLAESTETLALWVDQGLLTAEQAAEVAKLFETVAARAEKLQGANVDNAIATSIANEEMRAAAERADAVAEAQDRLTDATGQLNTAQGRLARAYEDGSRRISDAQRDVTRSARDVADAQERVARVAADVMAASIGLTTALNDNRRAAQQAKAQWQALADQGLITQGRADAMKRAIDDATRAAENYAGDYTANLLLDTDDFWRRFAETRWVLAEKQIEMQLNNPYLQTPGLQLASGGLVPQYLANGGSPWQPKGTDRTPAMLTPGEFVVRKGAVDALGLPFMSAVNNLDARMMRAASGGFGAAPVVQHRTTTYSATVHANDVRDADVPIRHTLRKLALQNADD